MWFNKLKLTLRKLGYQPTKYDNSLIIKFTDITVSYILIYVDDFIITGNGDREIKKTTQCLNSEFSIKVLSDLTYFLGIEVNRASSSQI